MPVWGVCRSEGHPAQWMVDDIIGQEPKAERSLMHRFKHCPGMTLTASQIVSSFQAISFLEHVLRLNC